jgi:hypothetical protein
MDSESSAEEKKAPVVAVTVNPVDTTNTVLLFLCFFPSFFVFLWSDE